jgi:predicted NAD/FAD-binding protein
MVSELVRFNRELRELLAGDLAHDAESLGDYLERRGYSRPFIDRLIVPQASAVWSADPKQMWSFPIRFLAEFFHNHGMLGLRGRPRWSTVHGGSHRYVEALTRPYADRIRLSTPVTRIARHGEHVEVTPRGGDAQRFDQVVIATHSDQALELLADPSDREGDLLSSIRYQRNEAILHTDASVLPRRRRAWSSWNYHLLPEPSGRTTVTYHMNTLQRLTADREFCVTLNRREAIDPAKVIRAIEYAHPVFTPAATAAQRRYDEIGGRRRTHFAGAYWGWGFHEDGAASGARAAAAVEAYA